MAQPLALIKRDLSVPTKRQEILVEAFAAVVHVVLVPVSVQPHPTPLEILGQVSVAVRVDKIAAQTLQIALKALGNLIH
jgi:hypothetical protein